MKIKTVEHSSGVIETRTYDKSGRLVEIRKQQPAGKIDRNVSLLKRPPGAFNRD